MAKEKATKIRTYYGQFFDIVVYSYRGREYEVTFANGTNCCVTPAYIQHRDEQEKIDKQIEEEERLAEYRRNNPNWKAEEEAKRKETDEFLDDFFSMLNGDISEEEFNEKHN